MKEVDKKGLIKIWVISFVFLLMASILSFIEIKNYLAEKSQAESGSATVKWSAINRKNSDVIEILRRGLRTNSLSASDYKFLKSADPENLAVDFMYINNALSFDQYSGDVRVEDISSGSDTRSELYKVYNEGKVKKVLEYFGGLSQKGNLDSYHEEYFFEVTKDLGFSAQLQVHKVELFSDRIQHIDYSYYNLYLLYPNTGDMEAFKKRVDKLIKISETLIKSVKTIDRVFVAYHHCNKVLRVLLNLSPEKQEKLKTEINYFKSIMSTMKSFFDQNRNHERLNWENITRVARLGMDKTAFTKDAKFRELIKPSREMVYSHLDRHVNYIPIIVILVLLLWLSAVFFRKTEKVIFLAPDTNTLIACLLFPVLTLSAYTLLCNYLPHRQKTVSYAMYGYSYEKIFLFAAIILLPLYFLMRDLNEKRVLISKSGKILLAVCLGLAFVATFFDLNSLEKPLVDIVAFGCFIGPGVALLLYLLINYVKGIIKVEKAVLIKQSLSYIIFLGAYFIFIFTLHSSVFLKYMESHYAKQDLFSKIIREDGKARLYLVDDGVKAFHEAIKMAKPSDYVMHKSLKQEVKLKIMSAEDVKHEKLAQKAKEEALLEEKGTSGRRSLRRNRSN